MRCERSTRRGWVNERLGILYENQLPEKLEPNQLPPPELNNVAVLRQLHSEAMRQNRSVLHANLPWTRFQLHGGDKPAAVWFLVDENTTAHVGETMMLTDDELNAMRRAAKDDPRVVDTFWHLLYARAIIAAYQAKLLAELEMPEPVGRTMRFIGNDDYARKHSYCARTYDELPKGMYSDTWQDLEQLYTADQLQAAAAQARAQALDEAKELLTKLDSIMVNLQVYEAVTAIEALKGEV